MALADELADEVGTIFKSRWDEREGKVVPEPEDLALGNEAVAFDRATVLYADLSGSTAMVDAENWQVAAEVYKAYLYCAAKLIRSEGGKITSYDGDRVMGVFIGASQSTPAARCALKINYAVQEIINPAIQKMYTSPPVVKQVVGIDTSPIRAARTGVRGGNDIVWVGRAANYAAKLCNLDLGGMRTWITTDLYNRLDEDLKIGGTEKKNMWTLYDWPGKSGSLIYGSTWWWKV